LGNDFKDLITAIIRIKNMKTKMKYYIGFASAALVFAGAGCNNDSDNGNGNGSGGAGVGSPITAGYTQVDRLARPAINEGLSVTDASLNAFNSIAPNQDLTPPAAPVLAEATTTLNAFAKLGRDLGTSPAPAPATVVGAFLPDEMRVDTRTDAPPGTFAYNASTSGSLGILTGGRKLEDDAMDITLSFLVAGDASGQTVKDNVEYAGVAGNPNQPGHKLLHGQTTRNGSATFPFLAGPN
jgi:hypothetical protein